eukprot:COSAG02_NODE_34067_length_490_cov_0.764706_1_plen_53_part_10
MSLTLGHTCMNGEGMLVGPVCGGFCGGVRLSRVDPATKTATNGAKLTPVAPIG